MPILGLMNAESFATNRFQSHRREVFYFYPNGAAPLMGLLSLMKDQAIDDPRHNWNEKRLSENWGVAANISTTVVFYSTGVTVAAGKVTAATVAAANFTPTAGTQYAIKLSATPENTFRIGHIFRFVATNTSGNPEEVIGRINAINTSSDTPASTLGFTAVRTTAVAVDYDVSTHAGTQVAVIGSAFAEGVQDESSGIYNEPVSPYNYTQIFRKPVTITGTALKTSAKFDEQGVFPDQSKEAAVDFAREMEWANFFGERNQLGSASTSITRYMGGILYFLKLWEAGSTYGNTAATADTDDTKRIISNTATTVSITQFDGWMERVFRISNNKSTEKIAFCGSGALLTLNRLFKNNGMQTSSMPLKDTYGMDVRAYTSPSGTLYLKTHPLMSQNSVLRYNMMVVDLPNLTYTYLRGRDMELLKNRQPNDADYRKDEWLGESTLELNLPESFMYIQNLVTAV
jgi:hypothetical protein